MMILILPWAPWDRLGSKNLDGLLSIRSLVECGVGWKLERSSHEAGFYYKVSIDVAGCSIASSVNVQKIKILPALPFVRNYGWQIKFIELLIFLSRGLGRGYVVEKIQNEQWLYLTSYHKIQSSLSNDAPEIEFPGYLLGVCSQYHLNWNRIMCRGAGWTWVRHWRRH